MLLRKLALSLLTVFAFSSVKAQSTDSLAVSPAQWVDSVYEAEVVPNAVTDTLRYDSLVSLLPLPNTFFIPFVYSDYIRTDSADVFRGDFSGNPEMRWVEAVDATQRRVRQMQAHVFYKHPEVARYNVWMLPEAPKQYHSVVNPRNHTIEIRELASSAPRLSTISANEVGRRYWINVFNASLQFSQAYVSPNWYQGGNNNVNTLGQAFYNVKLNQAYFPKILFETTAQYKLGLNNAPNDTVHDVSISDDLFQVNTTLGIKAAKSWYYSLTGQFKTQLLHQYPSNSRTLRSAFMSPGQLTVGVGMTYNYTTKDKHITYDASMAPLSYNVKTCYNTNINPTLYGIPEGETVRQDFGSSFELKVRWKIAYNINYSSRIFFFTDYSNAQTDWENTVVFEINRYLTTQLYVHMRYDSSTPPTPDSSWKKFQMKEILSLGFAYKFSDI